MHVDLVSEAQHASLIDLLCELHAFYNENSVVQREVVREHLLDNLLATDSPHRLAVVASDDGQVLGLAAITLVYSLVEFAVEKRKQCQLKELYVKSSDRNKGAGRALMLWVAQYALERGYHRIDWPVKASNTRGISFYESLGAERVADRHSYRLSQSALAMLADHT